VPLRMLEIPVSGCRPILLEPAILTLNKPNKPTETLKTASSASSRLAFVTFFYIISNYSLNYYQRHTNVIIQSLDGASVMILPKDIHLVCILKHTICDTKKSIRKSLYIRV